MKKFVLLYFFHLKGKNPHLGKRDTAAIDAIQKVTRALESSGIIADNSAEEDTDNVLIKRSVGSTDVTTEQMTDQPTTFETFEPSIQADNL